ncbi:MAG: metal ABC transporter ATP-binding protein [Ruminococcaceae bacterium]|nr:metal ABC transporter ATP-binding protein [Oscillospiraceae bacterium]
MSLLCCQDLCMHYDSINAVCHVDFSVEEGDYLCVVGENGSGKSTLMKGILGLLPPSHGRVSLSGLTQGEIGYLPQQTQIQKDFPASVYEVTLSGCRNRRGKRPFYTKAEHCRAEEMLCLLNIQNIKNRSYRELSGGQQQRVLLARALCATEKLLLLDEPAAGLDPAATADLYQIIKNLNQNHGVTVIMVSHDIKSAVEYGTKILHMATNVRFYGATKDYIQTEAYSQLAGGVRNA